MRANRLQTHCSVASHRVVSPLAPQGRGLEWLLLLGLWAALPTLSAPLSAAALGTAFMYQGRLQAGDTAANGSFDLRFALYDTFSGGSPLGLTTNAAVSLSNGFFTATLDFGGAFDGNARWVEVAVRTNGGGAFTPLAPRQPVAPAPYALYAPSAGVAASALTAATATSVSPGVVSQLGTPDRRLTNALQVTTNGWVGLGTNAPAAALHIAGGSPVLAPVVSAQVMDHSGGFSNLAGAACLAFSGTSVLAVGGEQGVTLVDASYGHLNLASQIVDGWGPFTNLWKVHGVAFSSNGLLAIAATGDHAVTLANVADPVSPIYRASLRDGVGGWDFLGGAYTVAFQGNLLAIAATNDHSVTLADVSTPSAPLLRFVLNAGSGFNRLHNPRALAFLGNVLAIAAVDDDSVSLVDVSNPSAPFLLAVLNPNTGFPSLSGPLALAAQGTLLAVAAEKVNSGGRVLNTGVSLVEVSNPAAPVLRAVIGDLSSPNHLSPTGVAFQRHLDWSAGRYVPLLAVADGQSDGVVFYDVTDPANPAWRGAATYSLAGADYLHQPNAIAANADSVAVSGSVLFQATLTLLSPTDQRVGLAVQDWVGIGTTAPKAALDVKGDLIVESAERVTLQATHLAMGVSAAASGWNSVALGPIASSSGDNAIALGWGSSAEGDFSAALGVMATARGYGSVALGHNTAAVGAESTALGTLSVAEGAASVALGSNTLASGSGALAMGLLSQAGGAGALAAGSNTLTAGAGAVALGLETQATNTAATAVGANSIAGGFASLAAGRQAIARHDGAFVWADGQNGLFSSTASNQFLIRAGGGVGIATNNPQSALHVHGVVTAVSFAGNLAGNAATASSAGAFTGSLAGDVTGPQGATVVTAVGGQSAANVGSGVSLANAATNLNTPATLVRRDSAGDFAAGNITASLFTGNGAGLTNLTVPAASLVGPLSLTQLPNTLLTNTAPNVTLNGSFSGAGNNLTNLNATNLVGTVADIRLPANLARTNQVWLLNGNAGTTVGTQFVGTLDNQPLEFKANGLRALRLEPNPTSPNVLGGFNGNIISNGVAGAVIGGGGSVTNLNRVGGSYSAVLAGYNNLAYRGSAVIAGGDNNLAAHDRATVSGGFSNWAVGQLSVVAGGAQNLASGVGSIVAGGSQNRATGDFSVAMGNNVTASNTSAIALGDFSLASGVSSMALGHYANATADYATAIGPRLTASGYIATAMGYHAYATNAQCFVWADGNVDTYSTTNYQFLVRAIGGTVFYSGNATNSGVRLAPGAGAWTTLSDRQAKDQIQPVDSQEVLEKLAALPVATWNYKAQDPSIRHLGPMAQDFKAAFGLGESDTGISTVDADGVALAAIQGLNRKVEAENATLRAELQSRDAELQALKTRFEALERKLAR